MKTTRAPRVSEKVEQQHGVQLLRAIGATVYVSGTTRRRDDFHGTMQTPGIPDVESFLPLRMVHLDPAPGSHQSYTSQRRRLLKWEAKARGGRLRPEQLEYQRLCAEAEVAHVVGDCNALIAWLIEHGYLKPDQVAHYRLTTSA